MFSIQKRTIDTYIGEGVFKVEVNDSEETIFDYEHICKILGLERLPDEPFITTDEAIKILNLPLGYNKGHIRKYCRKHKIPFYVLRNSRGTKTYYLRSELESAIRYNAQWDISFSDYISKNHFFREILKQIINPFFCKSLNGNEINVITNVIIDGKSISDYAKINNITNEWARQNFINGFKKIYYETKLMNFNLSRLTELSKENVMLISQNKILIDRLNFLTKGETPIQEQDAETLSKSFDVRNISTRVKNLLNRIGANNLHELSKFMRSDVEKYRDAGEKTIDALEKLLKNNGLDWKEEPDLPTIILKEKTHTIKSNLGEIKQRLETIEGKLEIKKI